MKIAYVEDDEDLRTLLADRFTNARYACDAFGNAEDLLSAVEPGRYDLLVLDIRLPRMDGVKLLQELRRRGIFTPAILITAFNNVEFSREALNASANYLLEKPFSFEQLKRLADDIVAAPSTLQDCVDRGLAKLSLARREEEVARLLLKGLSNKEIAEVTRIAEQTVKQYVAQIFQKAEVNSRAQFFSYIFPI